MFLKNVANRYLNPFYHESPSLVSRIKYTSWSHFFTKASTIKNKYLCQIVQLFAALFDATIGGGVVSLLYSSGKLLYDLKNKNIQKKTKNWNSTALKTDGIILGTLVVGALLFNALNKNKEEVDPMMEMVKDTFKTFRFSLIVLTVFGGIAELWPKDKKRTDFVPLAGTGSTTSYWEMWGKVMNIGKENQGVSSIQPEGTDSSSQFFQSVR